MTTNGLDARSLLDARAGTVRPSRLTCVACGHALAPGEPMNECPACGGNVFELREDPNGTPIELPKCG
ncbi:hypothetical protein [Adlercreutzia faecimuris]|uniref:Hydrogenase maturation nickel metallochaperone HypA n=1 Tax=Adlercreutzia faecimuris TaxID=2897341 RepID=A0ABS9WEP6_9ACTN|nr:hypothetical protein [Adlercreutzia sp. JBNU-10]MCI2241338.1 hypothetical protein [Adlercreutzia sp. JBNU-10]